MIPELAKLNHSTQIPFGYVLLEVLIAILVFSIGILGIVSLQTVSLSQAGTGKLRSDASYLANDLIAQMWTGDRTPATLQANFTSPGGVIYRQWSGLDYAFNGSVAKILPGATGANAPTVTVAAVPAGCAATNTCRSLVTVTVRWQTPDDKVDANHPAPPDCAPAPHCVVTVATIR
jgi:type IV pilus assembly protein PilV